jgi:hypothetical protein
MCSSASVAAFPARLLGTLLWFGHSFGLDNLLDDGQRNLFENRYLPEHWNASGTTTENYQAGNYSGQI